LDGEAIPLTDVVKLVVGNGYLHGLVLREVRRLEFVLLLFLARLLLLLVEAGAAFPDEEVHVA
jgi:hypothetical protein